MNPYETLEVRRNASLKTITKAYRRLAMASHPDRNPGDPEAAARFEAVQRAYDLLRDPDRRRRYDETGDASQPRATQHPDADLVPVLSACLSQVVDQLVEQGQRAQSVDVVRHMREWLRDARGQREKTLKKIERVLAFYAEATGRLRVGEGENLVGSAARTHVENLTTQQDHLRGELALAKRAGEYLDRYSYDFERMLQSGWVGRTSGYYTTTVG